MSETLTDGELTILGLLAEKPRHGYELEKVIEQRGMRNWTALGFSSIYYVLDKLAHRGLIRAAGSTGLGKSRTTFELTPLGHDSCATATREALASLDQLHARVLIALAASPGLEDTEVAEQLKARAEALSVRLAELRAIRARQEPLPAAASAIFSYSEAMLLAELSWAHETAATYERATDHEDEIGDMTEPANDRPTKYDIKRVHKRLYSPAHAEFTIVDVPPISYLTADGHGDPNTSPLYSDVLAALYSVAYKLKFTSKNQLGRDLVVGPLEGLWRADDMSAFTRRDKEAWQWTLMISQPDWITADMVESAVATVRAEKELSALDGVSLRAVDEGMAVQTLHIGSYEDEAPTLDRLHLEFLPSNGLTFNGDHHEIYLSDARRTAPEKLRTILRQPVKPL